MDIRIRNSNTKEFFYAAVDDWSLDEERPASGYLNAEDDDVIVTDPAGKRRNTRLTKEGPSYWDILPLATYRPTLVYKL